MTDDQDQQSPRWKLVVGHVFAWPLLAFGAAAVATVYRIAAQGYEGFGVEQGIVMAFFMAYLLASVVGVLILVTQNGWQRLLSKLVVVVEVLLLVGAIISLVVGPQ